MTLTLPGVELSDLKRMGQGVFAVVIVDKSGKAFCADGFVADEHLALEPAEFVERIASRATAEVLDRYRRDVKAMTLVN